jgi:hypothetical protein
MTGQISIFGAANQSKSSVITAQNRVNVYFEPAESPDRAPVAAYGTPGATLFKTPSAYPSRGLYYMQSKEILISVHFNKIYAIDSINTVTLIGTLSQADDYNGVASMTDNGFELLIITDHGGYIVTVTGAPLSLTYAITDVSGQLPTGGDDTCCFLDGYFIVNANGTQQTFISGLYDGLNWSAIDFASSESNPDTLYAVYANEGYLFLLGALTTEVWVTSGDPLFPFDRVQGATINFGAAAPASLASRDKAIVGLFQDRLGQLSIGMIQGGTYNALSSPDIDYHLNKYINTSLAIGFIYSLNGRYFYQITFPTNDRTWLYDFKSGAWSKIQSTGYEGSRMAYCASMGRKLIISDYYNGNLYQLSSDVFTENEVAIPREIIFNQIFSNSQVFVIVSLVRAWMETGQGLTSPEAQGHNPTIYLQVSRDAGHTWGGWMQTNIGKIGEYKARAEWRRLGQARDWSFKLRMTDPVKFCLLDMYLISYEANQ